MSYFSNKDIPLIPGKSSNIPESCLVFSIPLWIYPKWERVRSTLKNYDYIFLRCLPWSDVRAKLERLRFTLKVIIGILAWIYLQSRTHYFTLILSKISSSLTLSESTIKTRSVSLCWRENPAEADPKTSSFQFRSFYP